MKLSIGQKAPDFTLQSHLDTTVSLSDYLGQVVVIATFPQAWTPVCTNQIPAYQSELKHFQEMNVQILGMSIDHVPCLKAWTENLGGITYPVLSDFYPHGEVAQKYGILREEGYTERSIFIIDKKGILQYIDIHDIDEMPSIEVLFAELQRIAPEDAHKLTRDTSAEPIEVPAGEVLMYSNPWCPDSRIAREWMKENHIKYHEINIFRDEVAANKVRKWSGGYLISPTFEIGEKIVFDFKKEELEEILLKNKS